jgi:uncharacterized protein YegJ (DUF2314 family)
MRTFFTITLAAAVLALAACGEKPASDTPSTLKVGVGDTAMNTAIENARASLPAFWSLYEAGDPSRTNFAVNARLTTRPGEFESIWVMVDDRTAGTVAGSLANEPRDLPGKHLGDTVSFPESDVVDWTYDRGGKTYGYYTTRAILPRLPAEEQAQITAKFSPAPTEQAAP